MIKNKSIMFGGNKKLKIFGRLNCKSGKRMIPQNRVFFASKDKALEYGYRPCGNCMNEDYKKWKNEAV